MTAAFKLFKMYVMSKLWTPFVNTISLELFHQSASSLKYDLILPKGWTLLILWHICL